MPEPKEYAMSLSNPVKVHEGDIIFWNSANDEMSGLVTRVTDDGLGQIDTAVKIECPHIL